MSAETVVRPTTRLASLVVLLTVVTCAGLGARVAYRALTDSFVAPIVLSPDSDLVIASDLKLNELYAERGKTVAERARIHAEKEANTLAMAKLAELQSVAAGALEWTRAITEETNRSAREDLKELAAKREELRSMEAKQRAFITEMESSARAGLIKQSEFLRETIALSQVELAKLDTARAGVATRLQLQHSELSRQALAGRGGAPLTPDLIEQRTQAVRIELEILRLAAEQRSLDAKVSLADAEIAKIDELTTKMRTRPVYRAIQERLDLVFVPYTQIEGVRPGSTVHDCVWGLFLCEGVGTVSEVLPGEIVMPDPWGAQARGQYAVLKLFHATAIQAKLLRVRRDPGVPSAGFATADR